MKSLIWHWKRKLVNAKDNLEIAIQASTNEKFTRDMKDLARNNITYWSKEIERLEKTIRALEGIVNERV